MINSENNPDVMTEAKKPKKKLIITISIIAGVILLIVIVIITLFSVLSKLYGEAYDTRIPIEERTGDDYTADILNPPHIVDIMTGPIEDISGEYIEPTDEPISVQPPEDTEPAETDAATTVTLTETEGHEITAESDTVTEQITERVPDTTAMPETTTKKKPVTTRDTTPLTTVIPEDYVGSVPIYYVKKKDKDVTNFIFVGRDEESYYGRADSAMVVSYNSKTKSVTITSLLRDIYVPIEGHNWNKLGHALAYGGMGLYINTVNYVFDLDVQQYAVINFDGLVDIVDAVGGIDITFTQAEIDYYNTDNWKLTLGENHINGILALAHARNRKLAGTDFERSRRQRDVIIGVYNQLMKMNYSDAMSVVTKMFGYVKTNIPLSDCLSLASSVLSSGGLNDIQTIRIPFDGTWDYAYVQPPGYTGKLAVTKIDIAANRKKINELLY